VSTCSGLTAREGEPEVFGERCLVVKPKGYEAGTSSRKRDGSTLIPGPMVVEIETFRM
jgi:hypothetical protein